ncbi:MAG: hypothetical protein FJX75_19720, partial [Armatimonadetes bacterium]|nr:hypothetical protein [Armatimonadota bacterium]
MHNHLSMEATDMLPKLLAVLPIVVLGFATHAGALRTEPLSQDEAQAWSRRLLPLPKEIAMTGRVTVPVGELRIALAEDATELERCAADELAALVRDATEVAPPVGSAEGGGFVIRLQRAKPGEPRLRDLRNADQAYCIEPTGGADDCRGLVCSGLTDTGIYYAAKTLQQLIAPMLKGKGPQATVALPVAKIVDWPDLAERGEWGGSVLSDIESMATGKMNLIELHATLSVDEGGVGHAAMKPEIMERARRHALRIVPIIHHLEQLEDTGIFCAFPQLKAAGVPNSICFARPELVTLVSQWLTDLGSTPGVRDVMIWLSEEGQGCQCA